ncbi:SDR family oxidoreductase [Tianweitania sediminis]|uniref:SDR family oxidoreductase n=1 Tax=Tianweitania sediminis TaxID=1502156 RepID=UPI001FD7390B|nr:SDR family NAD(P)-dependent oxidoreductase [Tianweitania sediminis]
MLKFNKSGHAVVTGAGSLEGIGFAIARALGEAGLRLSIVGASERIHQRAEDLRRDGINARAFVADLTVAAQVEDLRSKTGEADILVNNAGMGSAANPALQRTFLELDEKDWDRGIDVSLKTAFLVTRAFLPGMVDHGRGRIINIASVTGPYVSNIGESAYSAAKAGMVGMTKALALEVAMHGITVNAIAPGWIATASSTALELAAARNTPPGRAGTPEEVAAAAIFLASDSASYVNGAILVVDGGNILQEQKNS